MNILSLLGPCREREVEISSYEDLWGLLRYPTSRQGELGFMGDWGGRGRERREEDLFLLGQNFSTQDLEN